MDERQTVRDVQKKILETMKFIDSICRENNIIYYIMGGTALGAIRHGGFIPWDDDLDIFMTPDQYQKFKVIFKRIDSSKYVLQEWKTTDKYVEYAKIRMNNTTFIEEAFKDKKDMHHGIYVDIMILHKVPNNKFIQYLVYLESKFVTLYALSQRNWKPKSKIQKYTLNLLKIMPCKLMANIFYKRIYKYDSMQENYKYSYWITPAKFKNGLFEAEFFNNSVDIKFEDTVLLGSKNIKEYLKYRYGDYMKLPSKEQQKAAVHAHIFDVNKDYKKYLEKTNE